MKQSASNSRTTSLMLSVLRIAAAFLFMEHGGQKLFNFPPSAHPMAHLPPLMLVAGVLEFFGGLLLLLGVFTRPVAFILAGEMAVAYFMGHAPHGFWPLRNMGELAVVYCFVFLYLAVAGGGPWSLERLWQGSRYRS
jgi:putative oxidoreductase